MMQIQWRRGEEDQGFYRRQIRRADEASPLGEREVCPPPASCGPGQRIQSRCRARGQQKWLWSCRLSWRLFPHDQAGVGQHAQHWCNGYSEAQCYHHLWEDSHHLPFPIQAWNLRHIASGSPRPTSSWKPKLKNYKEGGPSPGDYDQHCAWEAAPRLQVSS